MESSKNNYRWIVFGACFVMVMVTLGFMSSTKGLYLAAITEALSISRSTYSINDSCRYITTAVINLFFGSLVMRFGERKLIGAGFASLTISALLYATAEHILQFYLGGVFLGLGLSWTGTTIVGYIVNRRFTENKGKLMSFALAANGLGGALASQIVSPIIYNGDPFGYRSAYFLTAGILAVSGIVIVALVKSNGPATAPAKKQHKTSWQGFTFQEALRKPWFWVASLCILLTGFCLQAIVGVASAHMKDVGFAPEFIANMLSLHSIALLVFKFLSGVCYDKWGLKVTLLLEELTAVVVILLLAFLTPTPGGQIMAIIYNIFIALALPLETVMIPLIAAELFGEKSYAKALGILTSISVVGFAASTPVLNLAYDLLGTYRPMFFVVSGTMAAIAVSFQLVLKHVDRIRKKFLSAQTEEQA